VGEAELGEPVKRWGWWAGEADPLEVGVDVHELASLGLRYVRIR
jgi:hypothetical protein